MGEFCWDKVPVTNALTANPAAGAQLANITVPAGKKWRLLAFAFIVTTDATVANRLPRIQYKPDATNVVGQSAISSAITASSTAANRSFVWNSPLSSVSDGNFLPAIDLPAGCVLTPYVAGLVAGDDIAVCPYSYQEAPA